MKTAARCGYVALIGKPNVGKSTLLNRILGQKLSITSRKPQTTRHQLLGIKTDGLTQTLYVDTPGIQNNNARAINRYMNRTARSVIKDVDVIVFLVNGLRWNQGDDLVLDVLGAATGKVVLAVNKVDRIENKSKLLPYLEMLANKVRPEEIMPVSAKTGHNVHRLEAVIAERLPFAAHDFAEDEITDRSERFLVSEIVREKMMRQLGEEIPYEITVQIETFVEKASITHIGALIFVERGGQKGIIIGKRGDRLKKIGSAARKDIEALLDRKVMLQLWVKVKTGWSDDESELRNLGYVDK